MKAPIWLLAIGLCVMEQAFAQEIARVPDLFGQDSTGRGRINMLGVNLERELNTFNWTGLARIDTVSMGTIVRMAGQYTSNTILLDGSSSSGGQLRSDQENLSSTSMANHTK